MSEEIKDMLQVIIKRLDSMDSRLDEQGTILKAVRGRLEEQGAEIKGIHERLDRMEGDIKDLKAGQERSEQIMEKLALRSIEQETKIDALKRAK